MHDLHAPHGIACLQQLAGLAPAGATPERIARQEGLAPEAVLEMLERLRAAGFVERTDDDAYRLARPADAIRVSEVLGSFGSPARAQPGLTVADLLRIESDLFEAETVARAA